MADDIAIPEMVDLIMQIVEKDGAAPLNKHEGCWQCVVDEHYKLALNAHGKPFPAGFSTSPVPPYHIYVEFNGWPFGLFDCLGGGSIGAGSLANEDNFIEALKQRLA